MRVAAGRAERRVAREGRRFQMLQLSNTFINRPILSLRTGGQIATSLAPIINPNNLKIEGFYCQDRFDKKQYILLTQDIRDILPQGIVVDDHDVLAEESELIRLKEIMEIKFDLLGKPVYTVSKSKLGKVNDFAADKETLYVQKLYVGQPLLKSLSGGQLSVDRNQIVEITSRKIVINDPLQPTKATATVTAPIAS